jgi:hypothetical protein
MTIGGLARLGGCLPLDHAPYVVHDPIPCLVQFGFELLVERRTNKPGVMKDMENDISLPRNAAIFWHIASGKPTWTLSNTTTKATSS